MMAYRYNDNTPHRIKRYPNSPQGIGPAAPARYDDRANAERNRESTSERWRREQHDRRSDIRPNTKVFNDGRGS